jgi:hypothetical protein
MKETWIVACSLLFVALAGFAETPTQSLAPLTPQALAAILGQPAPTAGGCAAQQQKAVRLAAVQRQQIGEKSLCNATANCGGYTVSCSSNVSASSCSAVDRDCSVGEVGHVTCDGVTITCDCACGLSPRQQACCNCDHTDDCFQCCFCGGGGALACSRGCSGGF